MAVTVTKVSGGSTTVSGVSFRRIQTVKANIRRGYQVELAPYPNTQGKWLVRVIKPRNGNVTSAEVDSYFEVMAKSQREAEAFIKKDGLWGGALAERIASRIGKRGEAHAIARLTNPNGIVDNVTGKRMKFGNIRQYQNRSNNGLDILAEISEVAPPPPPRAGDFVAFEVKSTLGAADNPPSLSRAQRNPQQFTQTRLAHALQGFGSYPQLSRSDRDFIGDALDAIRDQAIIYRKINIRMDHSGALASTSGRSSMEIRQW